MLCLTYYVFVFSLSVSNPSVFYTVLNTLFFYMNEHAKTSKLFFSKKKSEQTYEMETFFLNSRNVRSGLVSRICEWHILCCCLIFFFLIIYYWNFLFAKIFRLHFCHFLTFLLVLICYKIILKRAHNPWVESVCRLSNFFSSFFVVLIFEKL